MNDVLILSKLLPCCCNKIHLQKQLTSGGAYFGLQFQRNTVHDGGNDIARGKVGMVEVAEAAWSH